MLIELIITTCLALVAQISLISAQDEIRSTKPKDYAQSFADTRVRGLVNFFELLGKSSNDISVAQNTNLILSLSESASKLYVLSYEQPLELRCDKFVMLLSRPNIRTVATISVLMKESPSFDTVSQPEANLMAKLTSERAFDALAKIQLILQTLEMERVSGKSSLEPNVDKTLLDCVNYYVYRHQRATTDIVRHVREVMSKLSYSVIESSKHEMILRKLARAVENIKSIESEQGPFRHQEWLSELNNVHELALENNYELPERVRDFLTDEKRVMRLNLIDKGDELKAHLLRDRNQGDKEYLEKLKNLDELCRDYGDIIPEEICSFARKKAELTNMSEQREESTLGPKFVHNFDLNPSPDSWKSDQDSAVISKSEPIIQHESEEQPTVAVPQRFQFEPETKVVVPASTKTVDATTTSISNQATMDQSKDTHASDFITTLSANGPTDRPKKTRILKADDKMKQVTTKRMSSTKDDTPPLVAAKVISKIEKKKVKAKISKKKSKQDMALKNKCKKLLRALGEFLRTSSKTSTKYSKKRRAAERLAIYKSECNDDDEIGQAWLRSELESWCERNPSFGKTSCETLLNDLEHNI